MDNNRSPVDATDWRTQVQLISRQRIVTLILETLKRHLIPVSGAGGLIELIQIAVRFEENVFVTAISQSDYLRIISSKMLAMERNGVANSSPSSTGGSQNSQDPASMHQQQAPVLPVQQPSLQPICQQSNMSGLQSQQQQPMQTMHRQGGEVQEQQNAQVSANILHVHGQQAQTQPAQQQPMSQHHPSQTAQMIQHQPNSLQRDMQQKDPDVWQMMRNHQSLLHQKIFEKYQQHASLPQPPPASEKIEMLQLTTNSSRKT